MLWLLGSFALAGCGGGPDPPTPTPALPAGATGANGPTGAGATGATGPTAVLPTTSPGTAAGNLSAGELALQVAGDLELETTLAALVTALYEPPPGALAIVWAAGGEDATVVGLGGTTFVGTRPTSSTLSLTITAQTAEGIASFQSLGGECEVTIEVAGEREVAGRFSCRGLVSATGEVVEVSAAFEATG